MYYKLLPKTVDIYYISAEKIIFPNNIYNYLDDDEKKKASSFLFGENKLEFILGRYLLKSILSFYMEIPPNNISFGKTTNGKLFVKNNIRDKINFNLSHSKGLIACAFILDYNIGIDVESESENIRIVAEKLYHPIERVFLLKNGKEYISFATKIWTIKEAIIKAKGLKLNATLLKTINTMRNNDIFLYTFQPKRGYSLSIAVESSHRVRFLIRTKELPYLLIADNLPTDYMN